MQAYRFLDKPEYTIQRHAYEVFHKGLHRGVLGLAGGEMYAYKITGGSNLDLPDDAVTAAGCTVSLQRDVYPNYDIILAITTYSATAPLTAFAKKHGFRGATMHGMNEIILRTGLAVDYEEVSRDAEALRAGMTGADWAELDFTVFGFTYTLRLDLARQDAQKSHGLCRGRHPDVANLPAGEVYWVPVGGEGRFPLKYEEDGTIGLMTVSGGRIVKAELMTGNPETVARHNAKLASDPVTGEIGELGLGTQELPWSGRDIQDEKVLGTFHVATGRSDHLGGHLTPDKFRAASHATHDDILFAPHKTPEITHCEIRLRRHGETIVVAKDYQPTAYTRALLEAARAKS
jgi:leucyl aminopeptidase (aminopeptidase T)